MENRFHWPGNGKSSNRLCSEGFKYNILFSHLLRSGRIGDGDLEERLERLRAALGGLVRGRDRRSRPRRPALGRSWPSSPMPGSLQDAMLSSSGEKNLPVLVKKSLQPMKLEWVISPSAWCRAKSACRDASSRISCSPTCYALGASCAHSFTMSKRALRKRVSSRATATP